MTRAQQYVEPARIFEERGNQVLIRYTPANSRALAVWGGVKGGARLSGRAAVRLLKQSANF